MNSKYEMLDEYGYEVFEQNVFPIAYLLTFRTFGTWLHGDKRESVRRDGMNIYSAPRIRPNERLENWMIEEMKQPPFILSDKMRETVEASVRELCTQRGFGLSAVNVRTNHAHAVVSAARKPERIVNALKTNATKMLRELGLVNNDARVWSRGRSRRYLWKPQDVSAAIEYTQYSQGDEEFVLED